MSELGHSFGAMKGLRFDNWGAGPFVIEAEGKRYRFGDSDRFGPYLATKLNDPIANPYPSEHSPFWRAHRIWVRQGRRLDDGINCIWDEPKPQTVRMIGKRTCIVIENGEEDGRVIRVDVGGSREP